MTAAVSEARIPARNPESGCHLPRKQTVEAIRRLREADPSISHAQALQRVRAWHGAHPLVTDADQPSLGSKAFTRWVEHFLMVNTNARRRRPVARPDRDYRVRA